jgi:DNA polymerase-3 subunit gamma/tau
MVLVRIAYVSDLPTPDEAIRMIETGGGSAAPSGRASLPPAGSPQPLARAVSHDGGSRMQAAPRPTETLAVAPDTPPQIRIGSFTELVAMAGQKRDMLIKLALEADVRLVRFEDGRIELALEPSAERSLINDLSRKLEQWTGRRWAVIVSNEAGQSTLRTVAKSAQSERERTATADPRVQEVMARFPGTKVVEVRRLETVSNNSDTEGDETAPPEMDSDD